MGDRTFTNNGQVPFGQEPSDLLKQFIEELAEEIVLNGAAFDNYKKSLRRYCEHEHFDGEGLIGNLTEFFDTMEELKSSASKAAVKLAHLQARECYISASTVDKLVEGLATVRANKAKEEVGHGNADGHDYVDLGLPSGTLWATCNIGASKPEDYGDHFAWGETKSKSVYDWSTYKYAKGNYDKLTKYCKKSKFGNNGFTDNLTELQTSDDPAMANWGSGWQTPSKAQWEELLENTFNEWTTLNGKEGKLFTSKKNGQTLFLPAAGDRWRDWLINAGYYGYSWSSSLNTGSPYTAWYFLFGSGGALVDNGNRGYGRSVRAVRSARQN